MQPQWARQNRKRWTLVGSFSTAIWQSEFCHKLMKNSAVPIFLYHLNTNLSDCRWSWEASCPTAWSSIRGGWTCSNKHPLSRHCQHQRRPLPSSQRQRQSPRQLPATASMRRRPPPRPRSCSPAPARRSTAPWTWTRRGSPWSAGLRAHSRWRAGLPLTSTSAWPPRSRRSDCHFFCRLIPDAFCRAWHLMPHVWY